MAPDDLLAHTSPISAKPRSAMAEVNLLAKLPRSKRNVTARAHAKTEEHIRISREYGELYFDGPREYGYGGYRYDGRWVPVAEDMIRHFDLKPGDRVLDVGAAKGFLVKDFMKACPGLEAFGLDISRYALMKCEPEVVGRLHLGTATDLPFPDGSFKAAISLNTDPQLRSRWLHHVPWRNCSAFPMAAPSCRWTPIARPSRRRSSRIGC